MATMQTPTLERRTPVASAAGREVAERHDEPSWLAARRQQAWEVYNDTGLPNRVTHLWRYSDPATFLLPGMDRMSEVNDSAGPVGEMRSIFEDADHAGEAISHSGKLSYLHLDDQLQARGVILTDLHTAARKHGDLVEPHLGRIVTDAHGKFEALNAALWQGGIFLYVPRNVAVEKPVHLVVTGRSGLRFLPSRLLVVLEEGAQLTIEDEYTSPRETEFYANGTVELVVSEGANLRYIALQRWGERVNCYFTQRACLERDANVFGVWAGLGGQKVKADLGSVIDGRGGNVRLLGMSFAQHSQQFDQHTVHDHRCGDSYSDLDFKVVLKDKARSAYTGLIGIARDAPNCEAYQENRNLLLSENTRADTIPELEILTDEVRCSHGATIGPVDEEALFYLSARGIPRDEAVRMVVGGFVEPTLKAVPVDLQKRLRSYINDRVKEI